MSNCLDLDITCGQGNLMSGSLADHAPRIGLRVMTHNLQEVMLHKALEWVEVEQHSFSQ